MQIISFWVRCTCTQRERSRKAWQLIYALILKLYYGKGNPKMNEREKRQEESRKTNPDRYFGSDLNKFIHEECGKKMIVNNIDLIMLKYRENKNSILRVIESKHTLEKPMNDGQKNVLRKVRDVFINGNINMSDVDLELFVVYGDQPYDSIKVYDSINEATFTINGKKNVINWLEMND